MRRRGVDRIFFPGESLDDMVQYVKDRFSPSRLCVQDSIRTIDRYDGYTTGALFLKDFVPYTKNG